MNIIELIIPEKIHLYQITQVGNHIYLDLKIDIPLNLKGILLMADKALV